MTAGPVSVFGTTFQNPILLAAGTAGFGRELAGIVDLEALGGLVTKSVSPEPRIGNPPPRVAEFPGGMLNSVGLANPGLDAVERDELPWLETRLHRARVLLSVVGNTVDDYVTVVRRLTNRPVITAFELNLSCPNTDQGGEHFGANDRVMADLVARCRTVASRALIVKLAPTLADIARSACVAQQAGADGFSLVNTMPGMLFRDGDWGAAPASRLGAGNGGVSGPPLLPVGILATRRVREVTELPVIGVGGIRSVDDVRAYLAAGAALVGVGTAALAEPRLPERLARSLADG